jgi:hypothetical protein
MRFLPAPFLCLAFALPAGAQDRLIVVDDGPYPGDFTTIQEAVDAAQDGDVVLVRPGTYEAFAIDHKGVSVVAEQPLDMRIELSMQRVEVEGGSAPVIFGCCALQGGTGAELLGGSPVLYLIDSTVAAGAFGEGHPCADAVQPPDIAIGSGQVIPLPGAARSLRCSPAGAAGGTLHLELGGEPADLAVLGWSTSALPFPLLSYGGWLLPSLAALHTAPLGVLGAGALSLDLPLPSLPASVAGLPLFAQGAFVGTDAVVSLGSPSATTVVELEAAVDPLGADDCDGDGTSNLWEIAVQGEPDDDLDLVPNDCDSFATLFVDDDAPSDPGPGDPLVSDPLADGTQAHPFDAIQDALSAALEDPYHVVLVAAGTYTGLGNRDLLFLGKDLTVRGEAGAGACVIDCQGLGRGFSLDPALTQRSRVEGLTIRNGKAESGAGAYLNAADTVFADCVFEDNHADQWIFSDGGGIFSFDGTPAFLRCTFRGNTSFGRGGGAHVEDDLAFDLGAYPRSVLFEDCVFEENATHSLGGGGLSTVLGVSGLEVRRTVFLGNHAGQDGGGLSVEPFSTALVDACVFTGNRAEQKGGGLGVNDQGAAAVRGSTFAGNSAGVRGGGVDHDATHPYYQCQLASSILWGNSIDLPGAGAQLGATATLALSYCDLQGGVPGILLQGAGVIASATGVTDADPLFSAPDGVHLSAGSPCIDAGEPGDVPGIFERDLDGDPRRIGPAVDMGADEVP